ncbi:MAG: diguanylate cyclase [Rhodocyclaceae bacterium]|nr:diguanylate cyclase [Rhodocyclaceae bacterium]
MKTDDLPATRWHFRLLAISVVPALLMVILLAWSFLGRYRVDLESALEVHAKSLVRQIEPAAEYALFSHDVRMLDRLVQAIVANDPDVVALAVYDAEGRLLASSGSLAFSSFPVTGRERLQRREGRLLVFAPIRRSYAELSDDPWKDGLEKLADAPFLGGIRLEISFDRIDAREKEMMHLTLAIVLSGVLLAAWISAQIARDVLARLDASRQAMRVQKELAESLARTDALTGLPNRRVFDAALHREMQRARRRNEPLALIVTDIDHFKAINDTFGHAAGDEVLRDFARILRETVREIDLVGRWGGEEFVILMPTTSRDEAVLVAERLRMAVEARRLTVAGHALSYTASFGVAALQREDGHAQALFGRADAALYRAKKNGRNRIESG